jgi:hypothetical protein
MNRILSTTALSAMLLAAPAYAQQQTGGSGSTSSGGSGSGEIFAQVPADPQLQLGTDLIGSMVYSTMAGPGASGGGSSSGESSGGSGDAAGGVGETVGEAGGTSQSAESSGGGSGGGNQPQSIGEINDIVVTQDGQVQYLIVGVGGFLGIGERSVAVTMDAIEFKPDPQNQGEQMLTIPATQQAIENAPEFDPASLQSGGGAGGSGSESGSGSEGSSGSGGSGGSESSGSGGGSGSDSGGGSGGGSDSSGN